jgi:hypothetical protein
MLRLRSGYRHARFFAHCRLPRLSCSVVICGFIILFSSALVAQVRSPKDVLGFHPTDDRTIADWTQITQYFRELDKDSPRVEFREIGKTTLGKPMVAVFISAEKNIKKLEYYRNINAKLADPRTIANDAELSELIRNGKTIVSISCSIHSTEIVASQMSMNLAYELAASDDAGTKRILENTILILIPSSNPDGIDIVADWYRKTLGTKSEGTSPPELYHFYAGHDNNRDWFMMNLAETRAITKLFWREWFPEIVYDVHQMGRNGARFVIPPFFDPPNPRIDPLILREVGVIGYKMAADLQANGIDGVATNTTFDTWWHGGFRSAPYYHNSIGILSEAASADLMSPITVTRDDIAKGRGSRGLDSALETATNYPAAWTGGKWSPKDIAAIEMTASRSLLELASNYRNDYLQRFYALGKANLNRKNSEPLAYIVPSGQPRKEVVARFLEILMWQGVEVHHLTQEIFAKHGEDPEFHEIPAGSFLIYVNQPQKNNILSLFEKQVYPHRVNAKGEPDVPYDVAGWTLPLQMGVETFDIWTIRDGERTLEKIGAANDMRALLDLKPSAEPFPKLSNPLRTDPNIGIYSPPSGSSDEGWTRLVFDQYQIKHSSVSNADIRENRLNKDVLVIPSVWKGMLDKGLDPERYPHELTGRIGEIGWKNLKTFVENGGTIVCFDASCGFTIELFDLPMNNVLEKLKRSEFYDPGSIVKLAVNRDHPLSRGLGSEVAAYFTSSSAFEIKDAAKVKSVAKYADSDALLSGWMLGEKYLNGKTAVAEAEYGKGRIVLFAFRPQHRGQTFATFPFIFNALERR